MAIKSVLFNTEMVRAILDGRKGCMRRIVKGFVPDDAIWGYTVFTPKGYISCRGIFADGYGEKFFKLPYQTGDILYVRETWEHFECHCCEGDVHGNCYKEPQQNVLNKGCGCYMYRATNEISGDARWHPSIYMPKEAARIWLKVTDVRVERLQEITEVGIQKEVEVDPKECAGKFDFISELFLLFQRLWNSTIKKSDLDRYGWDASPWVWVIEFERCEKPKGV